MTRLGAILLGAILLAVPALAAPIGVLVEERARADYAESLPLDGEYQITVKDAPEGEVVTLAEFWMDPRSGKFLANAVLATGDVQRIGGLALITLPVPVPTRRLLPDELIMEDDLAVMRMPVGRVGAYVMTDIDEVIGKQVRRVLTPGRPIQTQSIINPLVINRGDRVEISFSDGLLAVSSPGRALGDAHEGQEVRIVNLISNKTVTGIATGEGTVEILQ